jgi:hypothetical protein
MSARDKMRLATACFFVVAIILVWLAYNGGTYTIEITQQEAQERIDAALTQRAATEPKNFNVESVRVWFENNQILIDASVTAEVKSRAVHADIHGTGTSEYRGGAFYFHPTSPIRFTNVKVEKKESAGRFFAKTRELIKQRFEQFAAEHGFEDITETFKAEFQEWVSATAQKTLASLLSRHPIYTIKNTPKGFAIKAVLEKVEVVGDKLEITLSLVQLGYTIFLSVLFIVIAIGMMAFLIANPEWGLVLALLG